MKYVVISAIHHVDANGFGVACDGRLSQAHKEMAGVRMPPSLVNVLYRRQGALAVELSADIVKGVDYLVNQDTVSGLRYPAPTQAEIDTEEFE